MSNFRSDNVTGACPEVVEAFVQANVGTESSYGGDPWTSRVETRLAELFERPVCVLPVTTGSAANVLALAALCPPWGAVLTHVDSHINTDECGAPEFYTAGAKLLPLPGAHAKIDPQALSHTLEHSGRGVVHHVQPAVVSLTQATEAGGVYTPTQVRQLTAIARKHGLAVHMDGARFANAVAALDCTPADLTWRSGVDAVSFGATKNGAFAAEAVVVFDTARAAELQFRRKRAGHLLSKQRFVSAQLEAYLTNDVWLRNARTANAMAARLAAGLQTLPGAALASPVEANEIFIRLPEATVAGIEAAGQQIYRWGVRAPGETEADEHRPGTLLRLVTAWCTSASEVDRFLADARVAAGLADAA